MRLFLLFTGFILLFAGFNYFSSSPKISLASLAAAPPAEITHVAFDNQAVLSDTIQGSTSSAYPIIEWPFASKILPSVSASATDSGTEEKGEGDYCLQVPVILYHHIQPLSEAEKLGHAQLTVDSGVFEEQMSYLASSGYTALSADQLVEALLNREELPQKSIVITIDDGYIDNYAYAFLMAKKYHLIMNFMIPTGLIGKPDYMTWDHLKEMAGSEYAKIYNHTDSHAPLGLISKEQIETELTQSKEFFKEQLGMDTNIFTYPYGSFSPLAIEELKDHGFIGAFTTNSGREQCTSEIMTLHRDHVGNAPLTTYNL
jgi:peptidoglycan/xylan/chitin deacetylase (PgdA/CDA1 family)